MKKTDLIGTWKLISFKITLEGGQRFFYPYGEDGIGYLIYTEDNHMSVYFMRANRNNCSSDDYPSINNEEKLEIATNSGGYSGKYELCEKEIIHYPEVSSFPNFINVPQIRQYVSENNKLILKCPYLGKDLEREGISEIVWQRVNLSRLS